MRRGLVWAPLALVLGGCPPFDDDWVIADLDAGVDADASSGGAAGGGSGGAAGLPGGAAGQSTDAATDVLVDASCDDCNQTCCFGECVDLELDAKHCGACGTACPAKRSCNFGKCASGWVATATPPTGFEARVKAAATWTGSRVFIWGGADANGAELDSGALYDPISDSWTILPKSPSTPSKRVLATAVSTGSSVIVWGGGDNAGNVDYDDGAIFDLQTQSWTKLAQAPLARRAAIGVWSGSRALFHGGWDKAGAPLAGSTVYDPSKGFSATDSTGQPAARDLVAWGAAQSDLYLAGGRIAGSTKTDEVFRQALLDGVWSVLPKGPSARFGAFGAFDGERFVVWGGRDENAAKSDGQALTGTTWVSLPPTTLSARWQSARRAGWAFGVAQHVVLVVGGLSASPELVLTDGALLDASGSVPLWQPISSWPSGESHEWGVVVWTGSELFVWGGQSANVLTLKGQRYLP